MTNQTVTRAKGGAGEHTVDVKDIRVEDLWHIAQALKDPSSLRILATQKDMAFQSGESIIAVWHLCHDLLRHIRDDKGIMQYEVGDFLLFDDSGHIVGVSGNTDFWDGDNPPKAGTEGDYVIARVVERGKDGEITALPEYELWEG